MKNLELHTYCFRYTCTFLVTKNVMIIKQVLDCGGSVTWSIPTWYYVRSRDYYYYYPCSSRDHMLLVTWLLPGTSPNEELLCTKRSRSYLTTTDRSPAHKRYVYMFSVKYSVQDFIRCRYMCIVYGTDIGAAVLYVIAPARSITFGSRDVTYRIYDTV